MVFVILTDDEYLFPDSPKQVKKSKGDKIEKAPKKAKGKKPKEKSTKGTFRSISTNTFDDSFAHFFCYASQINNLILLVQIFNTIFDTCVL